MVSFSERHNKRHGMSGAVIGIVVVIVIIVAALAGYEAAASSTGTTTTVTGPTTTTTTTVTSPGSGTGGTTTVTTTITSTVTGSPTSTSTTSSSSIPTLPSTLPSLTISETGSSLLYPLFNIWVTNFTHSYSSVKINTASTGSGTGQSQAEAGTVQIGASDAYLTPTQSAQYPSMLDIPLAISAQMVNYNLPMIPSSTHLNFTGNILGGIYNGTITYWDDQNIKNANPGAASLLPHDLIVPIHRSDGSGDTFIFTSYLSDTSNSWSKNVGYGTAVSWPSVPTAQGANGNGGMVTASGQTEYSIAYIGVSYQKQTNASSLGIAKLQNLAGKFVAIDTANIQAAVNAQANSTPPNEIISLVDGPGTNSYPIVNYEYAIVSNTQPDSTTSQVVRTFLNWAVEDGNAPYYLNQVGFVPLPPSIAALTYAQIAKIGP